jgi:hypothetical protein
LAGNALGLNAHEEFEVLQVMGFQISFFIGTLPDFFQLLQ